MAQSKQSSLPQDTNQEDKISCADRIANLEALVSKLAVNTGQGNMLREFNIERWNPSKKDMSKYKG